MSPRVFIFRSVSLHSRDSLEVNDAPLLEDQKLEEDQQCAFAKVQGDREERIGAFVPLVFLGSEPLLLFGSFILVSKLIHLCFPSYLHPSVMSRSARCWQGGVRVRPGRVTSVSRLRVESEGDEGAAGPSSLRALSGPSSGGLGAGFCRLYWRAPH